MDSTDCLLWLSFFIVSFLLGMISFAYKSRRIAHTLCRIAPQEETPVICSNLLELTFAKTAALLDAQTNLHDTLNAACDMTANLLGCHSALLTLTDTDDADLTVACSYGLNDPPTTLTCDTVLSGKVLSVGHALAENDPPLHSDLFRPSLVFARINAIACAPLRHGDSVIGTIEVYSLEERVFTDRDLLLLSALARNIATAIDNARQYESAYRSLEEEKSLSTLARIGTSSIDPHAILTDCADCIKRALGASWCLPALRKYADTYEWLSSCTDPTELSISESCAAALSRDEPTLLSAPPALPTSVVPAAHHLLIPLVCNREPVGLFLCGLPNTVSCQYRFAHLMARQVAFSLQKAQLYNQVKSMALSDGLTGLANRRNFDMLLKTELRRSASLNRHLSLIMLDLDKFKSYNDTYGHLIGDKLLAQVGQIIHHNIRSIDLAARYGGEEFSIILPECNATDAYTIAEKLRNTIEESHFPDSLGTFTASITASVGIATYDPAVTAYAPDSEKMIALADKALYQAKESGRNRICANTNFS